MNMQTKPIVALASGALLLGALSQSAQAQGQFFPDPGRLVAGGVGILADVNGNNTGPTALPVEYNVFLEPQTGLFTYDYELFNPTGDTGSVGSLSVSFNTTAPGAVVTPFPYTGGDGGYPNGVNGVTWYFGFSVPEVAAGQNSGLLTFQSADGPTLGQANANGESNPPGPWSSLPSGSPVAVPSVVPEPQTAGLMASALVLLAARATAFGSNLLRKK